MNSKEHICNNCLHNYECMYINQKAFPFYSFYITPTEEYQCILCMSTFTPTKHGPWALFLILCHRLQFVVNLSQVPMDSFFYYSSFPRRRTQTFSTDETSSLGNLTFMKANPNTFLFSIHKPFDDKGIIVGIGQSIPSHRTFYDLHGQITDVSSLYGPIEHHHLVQSIKPFIVYIDFIPHTFSSPPYYLEKIVIRLCQNGHVLEQQITKGRSDQEDDYLSFLSSFLHETTMLMKFRFPSFLVQSSSLPSLIDNITLLHL